MMRQEKRRGMNIEFSEGAWYFEHGFGLISVLLICYKTILYLDVTVCMVLLVVGSDDVVGAF